MIGYIQEKLSLRKLLNSGGLLNENRHFFGAPVRAQTTGLHNPKLPNSKSVTKASTLSMGGYCI
ncbi:MAG: hypothetical protein MUO40_01360 [Anaerolineaceae bacterium]|nr:hypothetical protein [Anaerolineaceae bacterium]